MLPHSARAAERTAEEEATATASNCGDSPEAVELKVLPAAVAAASSAFVALRTMPKRADRMAPDALTRIASSHSGQCVGRTESGSVEWARASPLTSWIRQVSVNGTGRGLKKTPTNTEKASFTAESPSEAAHWSARITVVLETLTRGELATSVPIATNTGRVLV